jgi:hypothetical protein
VPVTECDKEDGTCEEMEQELDFKKTKMSLRDSLNYKYVLDMLVDDLLAAKKPPSAYIS